MSAAAQLRYDEDYAVEMFDHVEFDYEGYRHDGQVVKIFPRAGEVKIRFEAAFFLLRRGERASRSIRLPASQVDLERRDG